MEHQYDCVKLFFYTPLHLSRGREQYDQGAATLHSDTLVSALFFAACQLGAEPAEALSMIEACRISSAFPFFGKEYFFPKPMTTMPFKLNDVAEEKRGKPYKKIRYLGKHWFEKLLNGEQEEIQTKTHLVNPAFLTNIITDKVKDKVFKTDVVQRVAIAPDYSEDAKPFYTERLYFDGQSGLFILVEWLDSGARELFQSAFRLLGDLGIGTDKSVGNGFFTPSFESLALRIPDKPTKQCNLGLFLPDRNDVNSSFLDESAWNLVKRGGYLAGAANIEHFTLRKKSVYMFDVGSVFPNAPLQGKRVDLKPVWQGLNHPVWREGRPIFVPLI